MAKKAAGGKTASVHLAEERAAGLARDMSLELVEVALQKENRGKCLCIFIDKEGGISLDDCERYHRALQPLVEDIDYDFMEVSSPGVDRPIKTQRDFLKNRGALVELRLFAPMDGCKLFSGTLTSMTDEAVELEDESGAVRSFDRKTVALIKPIVQFEDEDLPQDDQCPEEDFSDMELE